VVSALLVLLLQDPQQLLLQLPRAAALAAADRLHYSKLLLQLLLLRCG
jgi:hypothetical protein